MLGHSGLIVHSGRQFGGVPIKLAKQEQEGAPPISRHCEFGPHGDGKHGSRGASWIGGVGGAKWIITHLISCLNYIVYIIFFLFKCVYLTWNWITIRKWIPGKSLFTTAYWTMIPNITSTIYSTWAWTWIHTFLINTCICLRTFWTNDTLWSTSRWTSNIIW